MLNIAYIVDMGLLLVFIKHIATAGIYYGNLPRCFPPQVTYMLGATVEGIIVRSYMPSSLTLNFLNFVNELLLLWGPHKRHKL